MDHEALAVAGRVCAVLDELGVPHVIGGSVAASIHGEPRSTADVDVMAALTPSQVSALATRLGDAFTCDLEAAARALRQRRIFQVFHLPSGRKIDVHPAEDRDEVREQLARRLEIEVAGWRLHVYAAEDIVVRKLWWYRKGGAVSDRQWRDVVGIVKVQGARLDREALLRAARDFGVEGLALRALSEGGLE